MSKKTEERIGKIIKRIVLILVLLLILSIGSFAYIFIKKISPVDSNSKEMVEFKVENGWGPSKIAEELEHDGLINSAVFFKLYIKLNKEENITLYAGTFEISKSMSTIEIIEKLSDQTGMKDESISITFVEGKRFPYYAKVISENFPYTEEEIIDLCSNEEYLKTLINKYWFMTDEVLNDKLYYPLEGYIFPDTYQIKKDATKEEIIEKMLNQMGDKLSNYKGKIEENGLKIHSLLTMASMVELEGVTAEDRVILAGVFYNRIKLRITLGSDVTTYYATRKEMTQSLTYSDLNDCNAYNTRGTCVRGLPVGPIASPSLSSIEAAINPEETKYIFFVADKHNKLYFGVTESDHQRNIRDLCSKGLWPEAC